MSFHGVGKWQSLVVWLEVDPNNEEELVVCEARFSSEEDRLAYLEERIATGLVYDLVGAVDSSWVEVENPLPDVEETPENGFIPTKKSLQGWGRG